MTPESITKILYMVVTCTAGYIMEEKKLVESISHTEIKNVLVKHGIEWRNSKTVLGKSRDTEYELKKIGLKN